MTTVTGTQYLLPLGRQKEYTLSVIIGCAINVVLNGVLIVVLKSIGAAIATFVAELIILIVQLYYLRNDFDLKYIMSQFIKYSLFGLAMFCIVKYVSSFFDISIISTFIEITVGGVVYILLLIISKDSIIRTGVQTFKRKRK